MDYAIPRTHDAPMKWLMWDFDQCMVVGIGFAFGLLTELILPGIALGLLGARWYGKKKAGQHRNFVLHLMYWYLPSEWLFPFPFMPPSSTREFIG